MSTNQQWDQFYSSGDEPAPEKKRGIPKAAWGIGLGCLLLLVIGLVVGILGYQWFFGARDPIAAKVPADTAVYMSLDLKKAQSDELQNIIRVFSQMGGVEDVKTTAELIDEALGDLSMSFEDDIQPWIGLHAALVSMDPEMGAGVVIIETRSQAGADKFISDLTAALEDTQGTTFDEQRAGNITMFVSDDPYNAMTIARSGGLLYIASDEDALLDIVDAGRSDVLANTKAYKNTMAALRGDRLVTIFVSGEAYGEMAGPYSDSGLGGAYGLVAEGVLGMGIAASADDAGLRFDAAIAYDESALDAYQKRVVQATYKDPTTARLVPDDTFLFLGVNGSTTANSFLDSENPAADDIRESLELFEDETGLNAIEVLDALGGEFGFALGPANDGMLAEQSGTNMGMSMFIGTTDDDVVRSWLDDAMDVLGEQTGTEMQRSDLGIGRYDLQEVRIESPYESGTAFLYGVQDGLLIIGSSEDMLTRALEDNQSLANDSAYRDTWKAFSPGSHPLLYVDMAGFMDFLESTGELDYTDDAVVRGLRDIPTIAATINNAPAFTQSFSLIVFVEGGN